MKYMYLAKFLISASTLVACAPAASGNPSTAYVQPVGLPAYLTYGQVWKVTFPQETLIYTLTVYPEKVGAGSFAFALPTTFSTQDSNVTAQKLGVFYDPVDQDPEFLDFGVIRSQANNNAKINLHCFVQQPSEQADTTKFKGVFAHDIKEPQVLDYINTGNRSNLPECTIELLK